MEWVIDAALDKVRCAVDGQKHVTLYRQARLVGGVAARSGESDEALADRLVKELPASAKDLKLARKTALDGDCSRPARAAANQ